MPAVMILCCVAAGLWLLMFLPAAAGFVDFWPAMSAAVAFLAVSGCILDRKEMPNIFRFKARYLITEVVAVVLLYLVFYIGKTVSSAILPFAESQIVEIYGKKEQANVILIGLLLLFWIGPGEEIFWRGFVQNRLTKNLGPLKGYLLTSLVYTAVHIWSFNLLLIGAAMICGLFWGYMFYRCKSIWPGLISHALWDVIIFVILPL